MKQFLYLDTDIVNSIIAQSEKGLVQEQSEESENNKTKSTHVSGGMEGSGAAEGSFLKLAKAEASLSLSGELGKECVSATTSREIISKFFMMLRLILRILIFNLRNFLLGKTTQMSTEIMWN